MIFMAKIYKGTNLITSLLLKERGYMYEKEEKKIMTTLSLMALICISFIRTFVTGIRGVRTFCILLVRTLAYFF